MSETEKLKQNIYNVRNDLLACISQANERVRLGMINEEKLKQANTELATYKNVKKEVVECSNYLVKLYKNIQQYAADRKELALNMLRTAIERAGYIVPSAETSGIQLSFADKKAKIIDKFGTDVNLREGSAYRTVMGVLINYTLIKAQPDCIQAIFLDEMFNTLSDETCTEMREYLDIFKDDILIVGIEQQDTIFQGIEKTTFKAIKEGKRTIIMKGA